MAVEGALISMAGDTGYEKRAHGHAVTCTDLGGFVRSLTISEVAVAALAHRLAAPTLSAAPQAPPPPPGPVRALVAWAGGRPSSPCVSSMTSATSTAWPASSRRKQKPLRSNW